MQTLVNSQTRPVLIHDYEFMTYVSARGRVVMFCDEPPIYVSGRNREHATVLAMDAIRSWQAALARLN